VNHSESMRNVAPPLQRSTPLSNWLTDNATWQPIYRGLVWANVIVWGVAAAIFLMVAL